MFKHFKLRLLLTIVFFSSLLLVKAQTPKQFSVDTITTLASDGLPFDRPFVLRFRGKDANSIYRAAILEWEVKKGVKKLKEEKGRVKITVLPITSVFPRKDGVDIHFPALPPDINIAIILAHHFDDDLLDEILQINTLIRSTNRADNILADLRLTNLTGKVESKIVNTFVVPATSLSSVTFFGFAWNSPAMVVTGYRAFYNASLQNHYDSLQYLAASVYPELTTANLRSLTAVADAAKVTSAELSNLASIISRGETPRLLNGLLLPKDFSTTAVYSFTKRIANLNAAIEFAEKLIQFTENLEIKSADPIILTIKADLQQLRTDLTANRNIVKKEYQHIVTAVNANGNLTYSTWAFGNNEFVDLTTKGSYQLIPNIGLASIRGVGNLESETFFRPYFGATIYLRPVDKNIRFKYLNKRFLHRFSFNLGVTAGKIDKGEFSDLYNNATILTGVNYKLTREIIFSLGTSILQRKDMNPAIDDKKTIVVPYLGLSFDIDFVNSIQKITAKLGL